MLRVVFGLFALFFIGLFQVPAAKADSLVPPFRFVATKDVDFYGSDLQAIFDTDLKSCIRVCVNQDNCAGFSFNSRSNSCFPKSEIGESTAYEGAFSALKQQIPSVIRARGELRASELSFVKPRDLNRARDLARDIGLRHPAGTRRQDRMIEAAHNRARVGDYQAAMRWMGSAISLGDQAELWEEYAGYLLRLDNVSGRQREYRERALSAALNSYLRSETDGGRVTALITTAKVLKKLGRGRDMLPVLRLAEDIQPRQSTSEMLDDAIAKYGFRVSDSTIESDSAAPRICIEFSETLVKTGVDYSDYLKLPDARMVAEADGKQLCIDGAEHGQRYRLTLRRGLPAASGEMLFRDIELTHYVRDRSPAVRFPGRSYVLPKSDLAALPIETVNLTEVDLRLRRVSDRNLLRAVQDGLFGRPLSQWQDEYFSKDIAQEVWTGSAEVQGDLNRDMTTRLPLAEAIAGQPVGIYALSARIPGADPYDNPAATQWFVLSDLGISSMSGSDGLHVQVNGLSDAAAKSGVKITLVSRANAVLGTAETDETGYASFAPGLARGLGASAPAMLLAQQNDTDFGFLSLTDPGFDLSDRGVEGRAAPGPVDVFLATDRGAYRAGEVINVTALARDSKAQAIEGLPLIAILSRPDGVEYSRHISDGGQMGGHVFALPVGVSAPRGTWRLDIKNDPKAPALTSRQILVEDFLPERIDFTQTLPTAALRPGDSPPLNIEARYLFGAPGGDLKIEGEVSLRAAATVEGWPGYRFGRYDGRSTTQTSYFGGDKTDAAGLASVAIEIPTGAAEGKPMTATVTTRIADGAARPVERRLSVPVRPDGPVIGIKPLFEDEVSEGSEAAFEVVALSPDLQAMSMPVKWTVNRVRTHYQWYQLYGNWNWEPTTRRTRIATGEAMLSEVPLVLSQPVDWGRYELVIERLDGTEHVSAAVDFYAGWYAPADGSSTPDKLELSLDSKTYQPGDTAQLRIVPRAAGTALISVMSNQLIERHAVEVPAGASVIPLTVTEDWGSGAYVSAMVIKPMEGATDKIPARALGLAHASVTQPGQQLTVTVDVPEVARPRGTETAKIHVDGATAGDEVWLSVAAVDLGILNLTGFKSPDPSAYFYGQHRLGMELRDVYGRLIDGQNGALGQVRSGGDADTGLAMQSPPPTQDLMSVFSGPVQVDANGEVDFPIDLPAFNGTVRLMVVAWSGRAVGQAEQDMLVRDPVVVTASAPRFLAPDDTSRVLLEIVHADGPSGEMALSAQVLGEGLQLGQLPRSVALADQGKLTLELPVTAVQVGNPEIELTLTTPNGQELVQNLRLPVRANDPMVSQTRRFSLASGKTFRFSSDVFSGLRAGTGRAVMSAGPLAKFDVPGLLSSLDQYPYGCTEQVTSKAMPLLYLSSVAQASGLGNGPAVKARVQDAIAKVLTRQASNGAFGLWRAESGYFWLDAYASDFLSRARAQGYDVPEQAFRQAMDNLRNRVNYASDFDHGGEDLAYALLVLAREGAAAMGDLRYYADVKGEDFGSALAAAQLGAALAAYGDQTRADKMFARAAYKLGRFTPEASLWRADFGSNQRDIAGVLALAVEAGSDAINRDDLSNRIVRASTQRSTQEAAWTLMAAQALITTPENSGLLVDGQPVPGAFVQVLESDASGQVIEISAASGRSTDITLTTLGVPEVAPEAGGAGFTLQRLYYELDGTPIERSDFAIGERFVTVLRVIPHEDLGARLMINDPLPAGFEIDNPNLLRSGDLRDLDWLKLAEVEHAEFRSDRFLAAVDLRGTGRVTLGYIARAVTPGSFHHPAASVEDMYRPSYRARTATGRVTVR
ncbi:alpha-2-macroglobulin family protein [Parasedimentitalea maritima]|uniref:Alpha-2-macroglobulin family protein n=1 Tax=Parasedimentitalea maritima TaxID=2578117 RepID=A0A6A4RK08_9RHOB|nr:alpha-2-macroglobulin family protein [Zongyanglinia marina]KAE9632295.1 alpha-2-macroglobulin family protein [Zongyanglinia marina]